MPFLPSRTIRPAVLVLTAVLAVGASACGGDDTGKAKPKPAQTSLTGPGVEPKENFSTAADFFAAIADATPENLAAAKELAAPRSDAARYLASLEALGERAPVGGAVTEVQPGRYRVCDQAGARCQRVTEVLLVDGKVLSFKLDGKRAGAKR